MARGKDQATRTTAQAERWNTTKNPFQHLTVMETRFVNMLAAGSLSLQEIALQLGWSGSEKAVKQRAWRLSHKPLIKAAVHELMAKAMNSVEIDPVAFIRQAWGIASVPDELLEGGITANHKLAALKIIGRQQKFLDQSQPQGGRSIINLIVQAAQVSGDVVKTVPEKIEK